MCTLAFDYTWLKSAFHRDLFLVAAVVLLQKGGKLTAFGEGLSTDHDVNLL